MRPLILGGEYFYYCNPMQSASMLGKEKRCRETDRKYPKMWLSKSSKRLVDTVAGDL